MLRIIRTANVLHMVYRCSVPVTMAYETRSNATPRSRSGAGVADSGTDASPPPPAGANLATINNNINININYNINNIMRQCVSRPHFLP